MPRDRAEELRISAAFGLRVRQRRLDSDLTQERLAELADLHPTYISNVERGYRVPTLPTVIRLARALDVRPGALIDDLDDAPSDRRSKQ